MAFEDLYQEIILDHYKNPRNFGEGSPTCSAVELDNPVCGDHIKLMLHVNEEGIVDEVQFTGSGCAISMASASMMTEAIKGKKVVEVKAIAAKVIKTLRGEEPPKILENFGDVAALQGVIKFPIRVKCATLSWHALEDALAKIERKK